MQCRDIDELMVDFLYHELEAPQAKAFEAHVDGCARCGAELASLSRTRQALRGLPQLEPSPAVSARLLHEAARRAPQTEERGVLAWIKRVIGPLALHPAWAGAAATLVVVVGVAGVLTFQKKHVSEKAEVITRSTEPAASETREAPPVVAAPAPAAAAAPQPEPVQPLTRGAPESKPDTGRFRNEEDAFKAPATFAEGNKGERVGRKSTDGEEGTLQATVSKQKGPSGVKLDERAPKSAPAKPSLRYVPPADKPVDKSESRDRDDQTVAGGEAERGAEVAEKKIALPASPPPAPTAPAVQAPDVPLADRRAGGDATGAVGAATTTPSPKRAEPGKARELESASPAENIAQAPKAGLAKEESPKDAKLSQESAKRAPSEGEKLHLQARKQATSGYCDEALALRDKISRVDPGYFSRSVAGDPVFRGCIDRRSRAKKAAPQSEQQRSNDTNEKAAEKKGAY